MRAPHTELPVTGSSVVETGGEVTPVGGVTWTDLRSNEVLDRYTEYLGWTTYVPRDRELAAGARELRRGLAPVDAVQAAAEWVHAQMTYKQGSTGVHSSAVDAWQANEGVCQDYAHLTLALLRAMGIPARYVSGYLHTCADSAAKQTVRGESHAWIEAWWSWLAGARGCLRAHRRWH